MAVTKVPFSVAHPKLGAAYDTIKNAMSKVGSQAQTLGGQAVAAAKAQPVGFGATAAGIPLNLIGLLDNDKFGAQLGGAAVGGAISAGAALTGAPWATGLNLAAFPLAGGAVGAGIDALRAYSDQQNTWENTNPQDAVEFDDLHTKLLTQGQLSPEEYARYMQLLNESAQYGY